MRKIIDYFKKYWPFVILAMAITFLAALKLSQKSQPAISPALLPTSEKEILTEPQSKFNQLLGQEVAYDLRLNQQDFISLPSSLPVYKTRKFTNEEVISRFAEIIVDLGFLGSPKIEARGGISFLVWQEEKNYLSINPSSGQFTFVGKAPLGTPGEKYDVKEIQTLVRQQLTAWGLISNEVLIKEVIGFGIAGLELIPLKDPIQASVFQLVLETKIDNYPLVGLGPARNQLEVKIETNGNLLSFFFNLHQVQKEAVDNYPLKSLTETINSLEKGEGQLIRVFSTPQKERSLPPLSEIQKITIDSLSLAYYETIEVQNFYQPVFLLKGEISLKDGKNYQADFILPAIVSQYLTTPREHFQP